jgi:hypothetical protein
VKQGKAFFTSQTSRANHCDNAIAVVRDSLAKEYNVSTEDADKILANVLGGGATPGKITGADVTRLDELGQIAAGFMDKGMSAVDAFDAAQESETPPPRNAEALAFGDFTGLDISSGMRGSVSGEERGGASTATTPSAAPPLRRGLDGAPPPPPPPGPPGLGVGEGPSWKSAMQVKLTDKYSEMVLAKDDFNSGGVDYHRGTVPGTTGDMSCDGQSLGTFSKQDKQVVDIAKEVLTEVRAKLPRGPFNNYGNLPESVVSQQNHPVTGKHSPAWWNQVVDAAAEKALSQLKAKYPDVPEFKLRRPAWHGRRRRSAGVFARRWER